MKTRGDERHGLRYTPEYKVWDSMIQRCTNPKNISFSKYGARGIKVCHSWLFSFNEFITDMGPRPTSKHSIDRINNDKGYNKSNCRWATPEQQQRNRTFKNHPTGVNGVHVTKNGKYKVSIRFNNKQIHLGYFSQLPLATEVRKEAERRYGYV